MQKLMAMILCFVFLWACSGGGGGSGTSGSDSGSDSGIPQNYSVDDNSSHTLQATELYVNRQAIRTTNPGTFVHAISYADFDQDGDIDVFMSSGDGSANQTSSELYLNDGNDNFSLDNSFFDGTPPGQIHPRKALTGDFNGDGKIDVFVIGHGYDQPPYPGEAPYVVLSTQTGFSLGSGLDAYGGFQHGGASADIDDDDDIDVFIADTSEPFFLINDGLGGFTKNASMVSGLSSEAIYTAELVDVDQDGYIDLLVGGHEQDGLPTRILWADSTGQYSTSKSSVLPAVSEYGTMIDIDVADIDSDGDKDIILNRTGDGTGTAAFYQGYYVQLIANIGNREFSDETSEKLVSGNDPNEEWFDWIRLQDFNNDGYIDIVVDDASRNLIWYNDGAGNF